jgi:serine/threonine protein kinase/tetratricopeptide (TPR) repeat protein
MTDPDRTFTDEESAAANTERTLSSDDVTLMPPAPAPSIDQSATIPLEPAPIEQSATIASELPAVDPSATIPSQPPAEYSSATLQLSDEPPTVPFGLAPAETAPATIAPPTVAPPRFDVSQPDETLAPPVASFGTEATEVNTQGSPSGSAESSGTLLDADLLSGPAARLTDQAPIVPRATGPGRAAPAAPSTVARPEAMKTGKFILPPTLPKVPGYEILSELGRGGMGVVYKARQIGLNRLVALKMVLAAGRASTEEVARFRAEAEAVAYLHHPNIVQVYDVGVFEGLPYFSLEFCRGGTLADRASNRPLPPRLAARIVRDVARAVHHAHQRNILHRDLKPANVLLAPADMPGGEGDDKTKKQSSSQISKTRRRKTQVADYDADKTETAFAGARSSIRRNRDEALRESDRELEQCVPKVTDFGLAKRLEGDMGQTRDGSIMGTPSYMAPEQAQGKVRELGPPADVYALGAILYDLLTGNPPFRGDTVMDTLHQVINREPIAPQRVHAKIPADLDTICLKCLEKDPAKRYASADALAEDLRRFLDGEPILARPTAWWEKIAKWSRRRPAAAALALVCILAVIGLATGGYVLARQEANLAQEQADRAAEEIRLRSVAVDEKQKAETERERAEKLQAEAEEQSRREVTLKNAALSAKNVADAQRKRAEDLQVLAEEHFRKACAAVDSLLARIGHERLAHEPRMEQIRRDLLEKAAMFYEGFLRERGDDPRLKWQTARTQKNLGDIQEMLGNLGQAEERYRAAIALLSELRDVAPEDRRYRSDLAATRHNLGLLLAEAGRSTEAEKSLRAARDLRLALSDASADGAARSELAASDHALGLLLEKRGDLLAAQTAFQAALEQQQRVAAAAVARDEKTLAAWREVARSENSLGRVAEATGKSKQAAEYFENARTVLARLVSEAPKVPEIREELGQTYDNLGRLRRDTDPASAAKDYEEAVRVADHLVEDFPATPAYRQDLATALNNQGILLLAAGKRNDADKAFGRALSLKERLAAEIHWIADFRRDFGAGLNNRGIQLKTEDRSNEADKTFNRAVSVLTDLVAEYPDKPDYQRELARTLVNSALVRQSDGRLDDADASLQKAVSIQEKLVARPDSLPDYRSELCRSHIALGALYQVRAQADGRNVPKAREHLARAESEYRTAVEGFKELETSYPGEPDYRYQQALANSALAGVLAARGDADDASKRWGAAAGLLSKLVEQHPDVPGYRLDLGRACNDWALNYARTGKLKDSGKLWQRASVDLGELVRSHPKEMSARQELAKVQNNLAILALKSNRLDEATAAYRGAVDVLQGLPDEVKPGPAYRHALMACRRELAEQLSAVGSATRDSEAEWRRVVDMCRSLAKDFPDNPQYASELGIAAHKLGQHLLLQNRPADAKPFLKEADAAQRTAIKLTRAPAYEGLRSEHLKLLRDVLFQLGDYAEIAGVVDDMLLMKAANDPAGHVLAAADLARCAALAAADKKLSEDKRQEASRGYADRAMAELQKAVKAGFKDSKELDKKHFDSLRSRDDFKELLKNAS